MQRLRAERLSRDPEPHAAETDHDSLNMGVSDIRRTLFGGPYNKDPTI